MIGEKAGYLGEGEDEDQVEEQFERSDALLVSVSALRRRRCRTCRAHSRPSHRLPAFAPMRILWHLRRDSCTTRTSRFCKIPAQSGSEEAEKAPTNCCHRRRLRLNGGDPRPDHSWRKIHSEKLRTI